MAGPVENSQTNRSLKLCQLINDRNTANEVCAEIRKLLIEGVDIQIKDFNRNGNTPLHLAVQKSDTKCIRFLLKYKPDQQIRNAANKTPIDLANCCEVRALLSAANFDSVDQKFVHTIEFYDFEVESLDTLRTEPLFKVLKILSCPDVRTVVKKLNEDGFMNAIASSSHVFFIAIETEERDIGRNSTILKATSFGVQRPMIIQITSSTSNQSTIYFTEGSKPLTEVELDRISEDEFMEKIHSEEDCNFVLLVHALHSNIFGTLNGGLLDAKLRNDYSSKIANYFAMHSALCHRFFKLFDMHVTGKELTQRVLYTLRFNGDQSLLALLDLPFKLKDIDVILTDDQSRIANSKDTRNYNLMMVAVELNNLSAVKILLHCGLFLNHCGIDGKYAADICWDQQYWECLAFLIEADSPYPKYFNASFITPSTKPSILAGKIKASIETSSSLHVHIRKGDITKVSEFISNNVNRKHIYDTSNKSALTVALESNRAEIYSLLLSKGFSPGVDCYYASALENCCVKAEIRDQNREYFEKAFNEPHLKRLFDKCRLSFGIKNRDECSQIIQEMLLNLNKVSAAVPILKIASISKHLKIVFDFNCPNVVGMDPTANTGALGLVYPWNDFIYIAAKNHCENFYDILGTIGHELTHYVVKLTYENDCKPFAYDDKRSEQSFQEIVRKTQRMFIEDPSSMDAIISRVFSSYNDEVWHQELIVRPLQLMAKYYRDSEYLAEVKSKNYQLFDFFMSKVLKDIELQSRILTHNYGIKRINSRAGTLEKIKKLQVHFEIDKLKAVDYEDQIISSNAPQLTLAMLRQLFGDSSNIFVDIEQLANSNIFEILNKLDSSENNKIAVIVDCFNKVQNYSATIQSIREICKTTSRIMLVMLGFERTTLQSLPSNFKQTSLEHTWSDLTLDSQNVLLERNVNFQGHVTKFNDLTSATSEAIDTLPLNDFLTAENFRISDPPATPPNKFYITRSFIARASKADKIVPSVSELRSLVKVESEKFIEKTLKELLKLAESATVVIISDTAGTGKSSTMHEIAKTLKAENPTRWTHLVDLKQHIDHFRKISDEDKFDSFHDFIEQNILANESAFERKLFAQFYQEGKTNVLLDGFDEISPTYKDEVLSALRLFAPKAGNQLWITTRTHLEKELEKTLRQLSCSLKPLTQEDEIDFLQRCWSSSTNSCESIILDDLAVTAKNVIEKLSTISKTASTFIGSPILIGMLAEIYDNSTKRQCLRQSDTMSFYSIYEQFARKSFKIWTGKGKLYENDQDEINCQFLSIREAHQKVAVTYFFGSNFPEMDNESEEWDVEILTRPGLIRYDELNKKLSFIHETVAEFFLTDCVIVNLKRKQKLRSVMEILVKILCHYEFRVVRLFLDRALVDLKLKPNEAVCKAAGENLCAILKTEETFNILLNCSVECREELLIFMLPIMKHMESNVMEEILKAKDVWTGNIIHHAVRKNSRKTIETLLDFIAAQSNSKAILQERGYLEKNFFHQGIYSKREDIFPILFDCASKILTPEELKSMLQEKDSSGWSVLYLAAVSVHENAFNALVERMKKVFNVDEIKELLMYKVGEESFLRSSLFFRNKMMKTSFFKFIEELLSPEEARKLLQQRGFEQRNIFHQACESKSEEIFPTLLECLRKSFSDDEIKTMLKEKDSNRNSVLHCAAAFGNENALNGLVKILKEFYDDDELKEIVLEVNAHENNFLHLAVHQNNKKAIRNIFRFIDDLFNDVEKRILIRQRGFEQRNIFHLAAQNQNDEIFPALIECTRDLSTVEVKIMFKEEDCDGRNLLNFAVFMRNQSALNDLIKMAKELLSPDEVKELYDGNRTEGNF